MSIVTTTVLKSTRWIATFVGDKRVGCRNFDNERITTTFELEEFSEADKMKLQQGVCFNELLFYRDNEDGRTKCIKLTVE